jgi:tRNA pseudouridine65 synthase
MAFTILYQDENLVAINKPAGFHVHPPEYRPEKVPRNKIVLQQLRNQLGQRLYPVHRLDVATAGVLLMALNSETAGRLCKQFQENQVQKTYWAIVRGYLPAEGVIDLPLESDSTDTLLECQTQYKTLQQLELPYSVGKKYPTARYSWIEVQPKTGRFHQIRRHMNRIAHPILGDCEHGDSHHNRFFRETLKISGLCLTARELRITCPTKQEELIISAPMSFKWKKIERLFKEQK